MASTFQSALLRAKKKRQGQRPAPADPPLGTYDPAIDAQGRTAQRNYDDLIQNFGIGKQRAQDDLSLALGDVATGQQQLTQDRTRATANLDRNYGGLATRQAEGALQHGIQSEGILAQALARRQANRSVDQQGVDTSFQRASQGNTQRSDALKLAFDRAFGPSGDNVVSLARAGRDLNAGRLDLNAQKWYAAVANGYSPVIPRRKTKRQGHVIV